MYHQADATIPLGLPSHSTFSVIARELLGTAQLLDQVDELTGDSHSESLGHDLRLPCVKFPAHQIERAVRNVFRGMVLSYSDDDTLVAEKSLRCTSITYSSVGASSAHLDRTGIALRLHFDVGEMWIDSLSVAAPYRRKGLGTQLVVAAEAIACASRIDVIHVFPLLAAQSFWTRNSYLRHSCTSRVLSKQVRLVAQMVESVGYSSPTLGESTPKIGLLGEARSCRGMGKECDPSRVGVSHRRSQTCLVGRGRRGWGVRAWSAWYGRS